MRCFQLMTTLFFSLALTFSSSTLCGQVLNITEIPSYSKEKRDLSPGITSIVDINSRLEIRPNLDAIRTKASQISGPSEDLRKLLRKQEELKSILRNQQMIVDYFDRKIERDSLVGMLQDFTTSIVNNKELEQDYNRFFEEEYMNLPRPRPDVFIYIIGRFSDQLKEITQEMKQLDEKFKVKFSLVAFRIDKNGKRPVHIENFDNIDKDEYYLVERWIPMLSPEEMKQLKDYKQLAGQLNADAEKVLDNFRQKIKNSYPSLTCIKELKPSIERASKNLPDNLKSLLENYKNEQVDEIRAALANFELYLYSTDAVILEDIKKHGLHLSQKIQNATKTMVEQMGDNIKTNPDLLTCKNCMEKAASDLARVQALLQYLNKVDESTEVIADKVTAFSLDDIPDLGTIDLKWTGKRDQGDDLLIKAILRYDTGNSQEDRQEKTLTIEEQAIKLYLVGPHITSKAGMVMANSYQQSFGGDDRYRFAPSGAALLKFGSRKSYFFNNVFSPGIGINVCSTDFNTDGKLEFAGGITATIFRDILSFGWDWNFSNDNPFWFVGLHLPFNLPGQPVHFFLD